MDSIRTPQYFVFMRNDESHALHRLKVLKALGNEHRLRILGDLRDPAAHFPPQTDGAFEIEGVCADFIRERLGLAAATTSRHLTLLCEAGLLIPTRKRGWTFYRRDEAAISAFARALGADL